MKIFGTIASIEVDAQASAAGVNSELREIFIEATREWVRTIIRIVPAWSGMSRASIKKIAQHVNEAVFDTPISHADKTGRLRQAPDRRAEGFNQAHAIFVDRGPLFFFEFQSTVEHYLYNELHNANLVGFHLHKPGPYMSQKAAAEVFEKIVKSRLRGLRMSKHIKFKATTQGV